MADTDIAGLTAASSVADADLVLINEAGTTKYVTVKMIRDTIGYYKAALGSNHQVVSSTTGTEVMQVSLPEAGTYWYLIGIIAQSDTTATGLMFGVNYTNPGTVTAGSCRHVLMYGSTGVGTSTGTADDTGATTGQMVECNPQTAFSTTAPNMGTVGVSTINVNMLYFIRGCLVATSGGDLELWHASETTTGTTTVMAGTSIIVERIP